jgi:lysophospholipase L1-like esterase
MRPPAPVRRRLLVVGLAITIATGTTLVSTQLPSAATRPTAVVAVGDSFASGEGAGSYEPATDRPGNFCHRSANGQVQYAAIAGIDARISIGCSGATTDDVRLGGTSRYGEAPQAERLRGIARDYQVKAVVLTIGMNNIGFANLVIDCVRAYFLLGPRCQDSWADRVTSSLADGAPKIAQDIADIRTVMREAGYADRDYQLVVQSYSSPFAVENRYSLTKAFHGCPFRTDDTRWARQTLVPQIGRTISREAAAAGARFLDLGPALHGREVCASGLTHSQEWANGVFFSVEQLRNGIGENLVSQSAHPNARGQAQLGRCLTAFYALTAMSARCVRGADGNLAPVVSTIPPIVPHTIPPIPEPEPAAEPIPGEA